mgnify:CR=1 FL=1|jgi:hypothetical protein
MDRRLSRLEEIATIFEASLKSEEIDNMLHDFYVDLKLKCKQENIKLSIYYADNTEGVKIEEPRVITVESSN